MRLYVRQFLAIAWLAALEALRQPIVLLLTAACVLFIGLMPVLFTHVLTEGVRMVRDSALALHFVAGLVLGALMACTSLRYEVRSGTAAAVLSKPVPRSLFFLAKFTGLACVLLLFSSLVAAATELATRTVALQFALDAWGSGPLLAAVALAFALGGLQNYFLRRPFVSRAFGALLGTVAAAFVLSGFVGDDGRRAAFGTALPLTILPASALIALAILLLAGLALAVATRLDVVPTLTVCSVVFLLGLMADYLLGRPAQSNAWFRAIYALTPNFQHFWAVDALAGGRVPWSYVARAGAYAALYLAGLLAAGIFAFRRMELRG
jgi:hypothetical protein